jgi:hypothetical protein
MTRKPTTGSSMSNVHPRFLRAASVLFAAMVAIKQPNGDLYAAQAFSPLATHHGMSTSSVLTRPTTTLSYVDDSVEAFRDSQSPATVQRYSLGLGRNGPVVPTKSLSPPLAQRLESHWDNLAQATQYLVEHQSVRSFPAPLVPPLKESTTTTTSPKKSHPPLVPSRITDDSILRIRQVPSSLYANLESLNDAPTLRSDVGGATSSSCSSPTTTIVNAASWRRNEFDLNTAWMELLIHEQQQKHAAAAATSVAPRNHPSRSMNSSPIHSHLVMA